jgi:hypothetical protein
MKLKISDFLAGAANTAAGMTQGKIAADQEIRNRRQQDLETFGRMAETASRARQSELATLSGSLDLYEEGSPGRLQAETRLSEVMGQPDPLSGYATTAPGILSGKVRVQDAVAGLAPRSPAPGAAGAKPGVGTGIVSRGERAARELFLQNARGLLNDLEGADPDGAAQVRTLMDEVARGKRKSAEATQALNKLGGGAVGQKQAVSEYTALQKQFQEASEAGRFAHLPRPQVEALALELANATPTTPEGRKRWEVVKGKAQAFITGQVGKSHSEVLRENQQKALDDHRDTQAKNTVTDKLATEYQTLSGRVAQASTQDIQPRVVLQWLERMEQIRQNPDFVARYGLQPGFEGLDFKPQTGQVPAFATGARGAAKVGPDMGPGIQGARVTVTESEPERQARLLGVVATQYATGDAVKREKFAGQALAIYTRLLGDARLDDATYARIADRAGKLAATVGIPLDLSGIRRNGLSPYQQQQLDLARDRFTQQKRQFDETLRHNREAERQGNERLGIARERAAGAGPGGNGYTMEERFRTTDSELNRLDRRFSQLKGKKSWERSPEEEQELQALGLQVKRSQRERDALKKSLEKGWSVPVPLNLHVGFQRQMDRYKKMLKGKPVTPQIQAHLLQRLQEDPSLANVN